MAKLILSVDGQVLKEYTLSKERTLIGRKPHNDIQIDNLAVSGEHAAIITILNDSFIEDLGSTNGTMVNGKPIKKHFLQNNDVVEIGKHKLKYFNDAPAAASAADFEKTMIIRNPAKAAPTPVAADKSMGDTQTNLKALGGEVVKPAPAPATTQPQSPAAPQPQPQPRSRPRPRRLALRNRRTPPRPPLPEPCARRRSRCFRARRPDAPWISPRTSPRSANPACRWRSSPSGPTATSSPTSRGRPIPRSTAPRSEARPIRSATTT